MIIDRPIGYVASTVDLAKLSWGLKPKSNYPNSYPTRPPIYIHPKMDPKPKLTWIKPCPTWNFLQNCLILHDMQIRPKLSWPKINPNQSSPDPKWTDLKCHLTQKMTRRKLNLNCTRTEYPFARSNQQCLKMIHLILV